MWNFIIVSILGVLGITCAVAFGDERLINGAPADKADWPASVYASMGNSRCTATVVGERALLIAAHCVSNGGTASFKAGDRQYSAKCTHAPDYDRATWDAHRTAIMLGQVPAVEVRNSTADWCLCVVSQPVTGISYENVNQDPSRHRTGEELTMTGYGCVRPGGGGGNDGTYRIGQARITQLPSGSSNDIVTKGGAALCFGDSGGPAFYVQGQSRWVVSVNSRGNIRDTSYLSSVSTSPARSFFADWASRNGVLICGIHPAAKGCRGAVIVPPLPKVFEMAAPGVRLKVTIPAALKATEADGRGIIQPFLDAW